MRTLIAFLFFLSTATSAGATISKLRHSLDISTAGSAVLTMHCVFAEQPKDWLLLPCNFGIDTATVQLQGSTLRPTVLDTNGVRYIIILPAYVSAGNAVTITAEVPGYLDLAKATSAEYGHIPVKQKFVNNIPNRVANYMLSIILPEGFVVNGVDESLPKMQPNNPDIPFFIENIGGRHTVKLVAKDLKPGDNAMISFTARQEQKSMLFLALLILASLAYLYWFRDTLTPVLKRSK